MKPIIFYVDDAVPNLTIFEATFPPESWDIYTFSEPLQALEKLKEVSPWVIISDQRMPGMNGVRYLELAKQLRPNAVRIIVTGYSEEDLVIESVRKAQIFDYIKKPWEPDELEASLKRAVEFYRLNEEARQLKQKLVEREIILEKQNKELSEKATSLELSNQREIKTRQELEAWAPPFLLWMLNKKTISFPIKRDLIGITFDIVDSANIHKTIIDGRFLRNVVIEKFSETILKHGGWRESHSGDSSYGHFGLLEGLTNPFESALSAAREFRVILRGMAQVYGVPFECGIALHYLKDCTVSVHSVQVNTPGGLIIQKSFDTTSGDVDLLHRMEKIVHNLPGTNIILSNSFCSFLKQKPVALVQLGNTIFKGQPTSTGLYLIQSDKVTDKDILHFKNIFISESPDTVKKVA